MKKKEIYIVVILTIIAIAAIGFMKIREYQIATANKTSQIGTSGKKGSTSKQTGLPKPTEAAKGKWVGVVHGRKVIQWFDSGIDAKYVVKGNYGNFGIEVKDGKWHAHEVDCPNHLCEKMGWDDGTLLVPVTCIPNDVYLGTSDWIESYVNS